MGTSIHYMTPKLDEGKVIAQKSYRLQPSDTLMSIEIKLAKEASTLLKEFIEKEKRGELNPPLELSSHTQERLYSIPTQEDVQAFKSTGRQFFKFQDLSLI